MALELTQLVEAKAPICNFDSGTRARADRTRRVPPCTRRIVDLVAPCIVLSDGGVWSRRPAPPAASIGRRLTRTWRCDRVNWVTRIGTAARAFAHAWKMLTPRPSGLQIMPRSLVSTTARIAVAREPARGNLAAVCILAGEDPGRTALLQALFNTICRLVWTLKIRASPLSDALTFQDCRLRQIHTAGFDPLRDEAKAYADALSGRALRCAISVTST